MPLPPILVGGLELEVEALREPVQLDLAGGEEPLGCRGGGLASDQHHWKGGGEDPLGEVTGQVSGHQEGLGRVGGVVGVHEGAGGGGVVVVLVVVLLLFASSVEGVRLSRVLAA